MSSILGKLQEKVILRRTDPTFGPNQPPLQRAFTKQFASINVTLLVSEAQKEGADLKKDIHLYTLMQKYLTWYGRAP